MVIAPTHAIYHYPVREDNLLVCDTYIGTSYMIAFFYPIVLIVVCTIYAVLTRKIPEAFNESKHIGENVYFDFQFHLVDCCICNAIFTSKYLVDRVFGFL